AVADGKLNDPSITPSGLGGTIEDDLLGEGGMLSCTTCHDVHVSRNTQGCIGCHSVHPFVTRTLSLRIPNEGSQLCLTCHNK
ncbi:MAG: cytochrome c3 family protein, partial [Ignavibacteria bacterium]|nr:cytochrome c3 family protein [Ignavibacteria bacterium]